MENNKDKAFAKLFTKIKQLQKSDKETSENIEQVRDEIDRIANNVNKKIGLITNVIARNTSNIKLIQTQIDGLKESLVKEDAEPIQQEKNSLVEPLTAISDTLIALNKSLTKIKDRGTGPAVAITETPGISVTGTKGEKGKKEEGFFGLLKQLFSNPAVLAALAGIVYMVLPKEVTDKIKEFLSGFATGVEEAVGKDEQSGFKGLGTALKVAGVAIATIFGAKMINGVISAITTMFKIFKMLGAGTKLLGKFGKAGAALGVAGALAGARAMMGDEEEQKPAEGGEAGAAKPEEKKPAEGGATAQPEKKAEPSSLPKPADTAPPSGEGISKQKQAPVDVENAPELASVVNAQPGVDLSGIDPAVRKRLAAMAAEYQQKTGKKIQVNSGYRDPKKQAELYSRIGPPKAAPPGKSFHEKGLAFDINSADANKAIELGLFEKYGFKRPVSGEPWHIEASETRGGPAYADNPVSPGTAVAVVDKSGKPEIPATGKKVELGEVKTAARGSARAPGAIPEDTGYKTNSGSSVAAASQSLREASEPKPEIQTASIDNTNMKATGKSKSTINDPIPSPIANRGKLDLFTKHNTAYA